MIPSAPPKTDRALRTLLVLGATLVLAACASMPKTLRTPGIDAALPTPASTLDRPGDAQGQLVRWGGVIVRTENQRTLTRIEILAYPLDRSGRPDLEAGPSTRFLADHSGYLEPMTYRKGRSITVVGVVGKPVTGQIGAAPYVYPRVRARALHLWPKRDRTGPRFGIGIGFGIGR